MRDPRQSVSTGEASLRVTDVRSPESAEIDRLARLWYDGRRDGHVNILPVDLARHRRLESFSQRRRRGRLQEDGQGRVGAF